MTAIMLSKQAPTGRRDRPALVWFCLMCLVAACLAVVAQSKEIEATHEWQVLGANDTVAAGMHIRIDMTTGEKWVKIPEDESSFDESQPSMKQMQISAIDGEASLVDDATTGQYDYDMMYRALSKLPNDEKERIGLPSDLTDREAFEAKLEDIWKQRQEMLRNVEVAELPKILKDRIEEIKAFKAKPLMQLNAEEDSHILAVVKDLEYHLQDIDMARDFHTLGGWNELASLLCDSVIQQAIKAEKANTTKEESLGFTDLGLVMDNIHRLQTNVAWALGTAVKNTAEFSSFVVEYVHEPITGTKMTILELVTEQLRKYTEGRRLSEEEQEKVIKILYCLGSFLRGNTIAQERILEYNGPIVVAKALTKASENALSSRDPSDMKIANRLLKIATDMGTLVDWQIPELCVAVESTTQLPDSGALLDGVLAYASSCPSWRSDTSTVLTTVRALTNTMVVGDERLDVANSALKALGAGML